MATANLSEWTESKCLQLIREYRARPILWDPKDPYFYKKSIKPKAWREIGDVLNISPEKCKHKMVVLMSSFRREKAKIAHSLRGESDASSSRVYNSIWFAFKDMAFLMDKDTERKRQSDGIDEEDDDEDNNQNLSMKILKDIKTNIPQQTQRKGLIRTPIKRKFSVLSTQTIQEEEVHTSTVPVPIPGPSQTASERNEEISSFTSFIGNKMKKYSDATKNAVQQAICDIIFKADQNYYESNSCYENLPIIDDNSDPLDKAIYEARNGIIKVQNYSDDSD